MASTPLTPGSVFARDFRVVRLLADGGMGSVYVVEQLSTGKQRALKVMLPRMLHDAALRERFTQEARLGAKIASDHVVEVVGAGLDAETGIPWMAMELLQGRDLSAALAEHGAYALPEAQSILRQVGHALSRAHRLGIVHRDLKPENLFLAESRSEGGGATVKILDFGIAKVLQETRATGATLGGLGTPLWMAPEQTHGGMITPATDVWALGLIGFALLTGRSYWRSATRDVPLQVVLTEMVAAPLSSASERAAEFGMPGVIPAGFDAWFAQCVARDAGERFMSAEPCITAFLGLGATPPTRPFVPQTQVGVPSVPAPRRSSPRRGWVPAVVAAAVLIPALGFGAWVATRPPTTAATARVAPTPVRPSVAENQRAAPEPPAAPSTPPPAPVVAAVDVRPAPVARAPTVPPPTPTVPPRRVAVVHRPAAPRAPAAPPPEVPAYSTVQEPTPVAPSYVAPPPVDPAPVDPGHGRPRFGRGRWGRPGYGEPGPVAPVQPAAPVAHPTHEPSAPAPAHASTCGACAQGSAERCNGCDDNCNGMVDEGC